MYRTTEEAMIAANRSGSGMREQRIRVLVVDPVVKERETMGRFLAAWNFDPVAAASAEEARKFVTGDDISIAVVADPVVGSETIALVRALRECRPGVETILLTENDSASFATAAFRAGVYDCLKRPVEFKQLSRDLNTLRDAVQRRIERKVWERTAEDDAVLEGIIGFSAPMQAVFAFIRRLAMEQSPVLITGLIGTGKEMAARALHALGERAGQPLVVYRCCGVSEDLAAMELFGEIAIASGRNPASGSGLFESARGGTILLDEIGDLPPAIQRRMEDSLRNPAPEGGSNRSAARLLAATRFNLADLAARGQFAGGLYRLLAGNVIHLPSLGERPEDIPLLCRHFQKMFNLEFGKQLQGFSPAAERVLVSYGWPGNVRELENVIGRACLLADQKGIELSDLSIAGGLDREAWPARFSDWSGETPAEAAEYSGKPARKRPGKSSVLGHKPAAKS
jgi:DNA-binding NtrC family response regulator